MRPPASSRRSPRNWSPPALANREALTKLVRFEVDRALGAVGLATADEVAELTRRVHDLERQLREAAPPRAGRRGRPRRPAPTRQRLPPPRAGPSPVVRGVRRRTGDEGSGD